MSLIDTVRKFAPLVAETIANPALGAVDAVNMLAKSFGADPNNHDDISAKIETDPQAEYKLKYLELKLAQDNNATQNVEDARSKTLQLHDKTPEIIGIIFTLAFLVYIGVYISYPDKRSNDILVAMITMQSMIMGFYYGDSNRKQKPIN